MLEYDPETGYFYWKIKPSSKICIGEMAGTVCAGPRIQIRYEGKSYYGHTIAWYFMTGELRQIDHKDTCGCNNAFSNLRPATKSQNGANTDARFGGMKGVFRVGNKYRAQIMFNYKTYHLGMFDTIEKAKAAYDEQAALFFGEFARS